MMRENLLGGPPDTLLPANDEARAALAGADDNDYATVYAWSQRGPAGWLAAEHPTAITGRALGRHA